jgi:hypothetical protein
MKVQNTITGRSSGKIGNTVASTQFRQNVMRSKAINPKMGMAVNQVNQRLFMAAIIPLIRLFKSYLMFVSSKDIGYMSRFNSVVKYALKNAVSMVGSVVTIDFTKILIGSGTYFPLVNLSPVTASAGSPISIAFGSIVDGYQGLDTDVVGGFVYNKTQDKIYPLITATVADEAITTGAVDTVLNDVLYVYLYNCATGYNPLGSAAFKPAKTFISEVKTKTVTA